MKKTNFQLLTLSLFIAAISFGSCKSKSKESTNSPATRDTTISVAPPATPVVISADEELSKNVGDATKDYPGVKAEVSDGVINLSGEIKRADWQKLNPTLNSLHPKRVNSTNLTIK